MKRNVVDLDEFRNNKNKKIKEDENTRLFKELISIPLKEMDHEQLKQYGEIGVIFSTYYKYMHHIIVAQFRDEIYVLNNLGDGTFEYLDTFSNILEYFINN